MQLSISNIAWTNEFDDFVYTMLKDLNVKAIEIAPTRLFKDNPYDDLSRAAIFAEQLKRLYDIDIVSIQSIWYGKDENIFRSLQERNVLIDYTYKVIDFAEAIKCSNIVFGNPKQRNGFESKYDSIIINFFITIADYAKQKGIVISLEPNPTIYGTNFLNTTKETVDFIKRVNHPNLRLNLDLGAMIENNETIEKIIIDEDLINHIHISEPYLIPIKKRVLHSQLKRLNYLGIVSIEMCEIDSLDQLKSIILYFKDILDEPDFIL